MFDASPQTRILTPSSDGSLAANDGLLAGSRKRKRGTDALEDLLHNAFTAKPHPSTLFTRSYTLRPVALLPRADLPLSCLDTLSTGGPLPTSRLFEAHVKVLNLEKRLGITPMVLIACSEDGSFHYVVEREAQDLCVIYKLGSWVKIGELCATAIVKTLQASKHIRNGVEGVEGLSNETSITAESSRYSKKKRLAIEAIQSMVKRPSKKLSSSSHGQRVTQPSPDLVMDSCSQSNAERVTAQEEDVIIRPTAGEILDNIRSQYFEALYLSKASLAYFAKGPLSRARAAFHLDYDSALDMDALVRFLESLILPASLVEKKYKDSLPKLLSSLIIGEGSADEDEQTKSKAKKQRSKKMKPGKNGLYPAEENYIRQWWAFDDANSELGYPGSSKDEITRRKVAQLRIRETQLQMIVILETLALRPVVTPQADHNGDLPAVGQTLGTSDGKNITNKKSKKPLNLTVLIDVLVDRLCIWQSVAAEGRSLTSTVKDSTSKGEHGNLAGTHEHVADVLRDFCVEVIVPFFSARLPEQCALISRKLGGPVVVSPARPKILKSASAGTTRSRPGAITRRPIAPTPCRSLQRVLTDERHSRAGSRGPSSVILLMRSATAPPVPGLKREESDTPTLASIPSIESQSMFVSRGGVMKSKKFSQREVDLSCLAPGNDGKMKKAAIEAELEEAIAALKRPNRQLAGQTMVETAEKRAASAATNAKKSKKPVRNPSFQGVQIFSTPKVNRRRDGLSESHPLPKMIFEPGAELEVVPPSSIPRLPLSAVHSTNPRDYERTPVCKATPLRKGIPPDAAAGSLMTPFDAHSMSSSNLFVNFVRKKTINDGGPAPHSPLESRHESSQQAIDLMVSHGPAVACTPTKRVTVLATPIKQITDQFVEKTELSDAIARKSREDMRRENRQLETPKRTGDSIYKSLGWDDYDELT